MNRKQLPWSVKRMVTEKVLSAEWTVSEAAEAVGYSEQSIRRWVEAAQAASPAGALDAEPVQVQDSDLAPGESPDLDEQTRALLDGIMLKRPWLRRRSLQEHLRRHHGMELSRRATAAYLREKGLAGAPPDGSFEKEHRRFEAAAPLELIQADLFYVRRKEGGYFYGLSVMDDHSRFVLGVPVLEEQTAEAALEAFRGTIDGRRPARVLTDRGPQFYAWRGRTAFQAYVEDELWALHILAAPQHPQTLGKVERFHGTLRTEALAEKDGYASRDEVQLLLDRYVAYYNYVRPHQGIGGLTPADRFFGFTHPLHEALKDPEGPRPGRGFFLALNLAGRRLVVAGERPDQVRVLWDDADGGRHVPALPPAACPPPAP